MARFTRPPGGPAGPTKIKTSLLDLVSTGWS